MSAYDALVDAFDNARAGSQLALSMALMTLSTDGAAGSLTIHLPRRPRDPVEVEFTLRNDHPDFR